MMDPQMQQVPPGALPQEMADDVPINASEGEYVLPADVVRYIGLDKIEKMVNQAKEGLAKMDEAGRIGGEDPMDQPPMPPDPVMGQQMPAMMNKGGLVRPSVPDMAMATSAMPAFMGASANTPRTNPESGDRRQGVFEYVDSEGNRMWVPFFNGRPLIEVPEGFAPAQEKEVRPEQVYEGETNRDQDRSRSMSEWGVDDFVGYGNRLNSPFAGLMTNALGALGGPVGSILGGAIGAASVRQAERAASILDQMIEQGVDQQGNALSPEQVSQLSTVREQVSDGISSRTNTPTNPFTGLADNFRNALGNLFGTQRAPADLGTPSAVGPSARSRSTGMGVGMGATGGGSLDTGSVDIGTSRASGDWSVRDSAGGDFSPSGAAGGIAGGSGGFSDMASGRDFGSFSGSGGNLGSIGSASDRSTGTTGRSAEHAARDEMNDAIGAAGGYTGGGRHGGFRKGGLVKRRTTRY